jgi:hypothetical protein
MYTCLLRTTGNTVPYILRARARRKIGEKPILTAELMEPKAGPSEEVSEGREGE